MRSVLVATVALHTPAIAQEDAGDDRDWRFLTRATLSDDSHESTPEGYRIYGGVTLEGALARNLGDRFALELSLRTESREVDGPDSLPQPKLGSLEMLASALTLKWQPRDASGEAFQPYVGGGAALSFVWGESGLLDATDVPLSLDPVVQLGSHLVFTPNFLLTLDVKWHPLESELRGFAFPRPVVEVDPLVVGAGFGFAF